MLHCLHGCRPHLAWQWSPTKTLKIRQLINKRESRTKEWKAGGGSGRDSSLETYPKIMWVVSTEKINKNITSETNITYIITFQIRKDLNGNILSREYSPWWRSLPPCWWFIFLYNTGLIFSQHYAPVVTDELLTNSGSETRKKNFGNTAALCSALWAKSLISIGGWGWGTYQCI